MKDEVVPIRRQYLRIKSQYPDAIVLFRLGDFYETFDDDAFVMSRELEIALTSREMGKGNKVPLAGIPYHALETYLARLINRGYKVAVCEQLTKPGETKGMLERDVVRLVTPGTVIEPSLLESKRNNYLTSLVVGEEEAGIAYVDITTSEFAVTQLPHTRVKAELERLSPAELIIPEGMQIDDFHITGNITRLEAFRFDLENTRRILLEHFGVATLEGYGCEGLPLAVRAAGAIIYYLGQTQKTSLGQLNRLVTYTTDSFMALDEQTKRNLELFRSARSGAVEGSLLSVIDGTVTPPGGRLLRRWLGQPLLDVGAINRRLNAVGWFTENSLCRRRIMEALRNVADLERLINRVRGNVATPRELITLKRSLEVVPEIISSLEGANATGLGWLSGDLKPCPEVVTLLSRAICDDPAPSPGEGGVIREGFSEELDRLRRLTTDARRYLAELEQKERERTGIKSLRVGFNNVFGYYIEVSKPNLRQVPPDYVRKQTLSGAERFFTAELKEYEATILNARTRIAELEMSLFRQVCQQVAGVSDKILALAGALAHLDVFSALAEIAVRYRYVRPVLDESLIIEIKQGRHPVVERSLQTGSFVPNDTYLAADDAQLIVLTGPNMSGKSTYLRQVALIVLLAQIGSFVPAEAARIGIVDRIFTRIGARDDLAAGQSTFMVEMVETANILNNATPRSLLILDEIGRGTSTYDGLSIARAVAEYIHNCERVRARTVFATHYHEMVSLAGYLPRVKNFNVLVVEEGGRVVFLHKIVPGGVDKSYGIHVAQLAGLPKAVLERAREILAELEQNGRPPARTRRESARQLPLFGQKSPVEEELLQLDLDGMTPLQALNKLYELKKKTCERQEV